VHNTKRKGEQTHISVSKAILIDTSIIHKRTDTRSDPMLRLAPSAHAINAKSFLATSPACRSHRQIALHPLASQRPTTRAKREVDTRYQTENTSKLPTMAWLTAAPKSTSALTASTCPFRLATNSGVAPFVCPHNHTRHPYAKIEALERAAITSHRPPHPPDHHRTLHRYNHALTRKDIASVHTTCSPGNSIRHSIPSHHSAPQQYRNAETTHVNNKVEITS